jgi:uncharacterized protein YqhQ
MNQNKLPNYGGQAVIEGVMMRGANSFAIAVRAPDQQIIVEQDRLDSVYRSRIFKLPFIRGLILLWDALVLGTKALIFSANIQAEEDEEQLDGVGIAAAIGLSLAIWLGVFFLLPTGAAYLFQHWLGVPGTWVNIIEGVIRLSLFIGYIWFIGRLPEIGRVFSYHGAEHMTINAFEEGQDVSLENVRHASRQHPRCGTAFVLTVVVLSVLLFGVLGPLPLGTRLLSRIVLVPVLASVSYEYIRLTARLMHTALGRWLAKPNMWLQNLTTFPPSDEMLEVAIAAFKAMQASESEQLHPDAVTL